MVDFTRKNIRLQATNYLGPQWYFLTLCTQGRERRFVDGGVVATLLDLLREACVSLGFGLWAYCFMPDHLHLLVAGENPQSDLLRFMKIFRQKAAYRIKQSGAAPLWQKKYFDHILRDGASWEAVAWYIWANPVRAGLCARPYDWAFSGSFKVDWRRLLAPPQHPWNPSWEPT